MVRYRSNYYGSRHFWWLWVTKKAGMPGAQFSRRNSVRLHILLLLTIYIYSSDQIRHASIRGKWACLLGFQPRLYLKESQHSPKFSALMGFSSYAHTVWRRTTKFVTVTHVEDGCPDKKPLWLLKEDVLPRTTDCLTKRRRPSAQKLQETQLICRWPPVKVP